jgi:hypothetical protein
LADWLGLVESHLRRKDEDAPKVGNPAHLLGTRTSRVFFDLTPNRLLVGVVVMVMVVVMVGMDYHHNLRLRRKGYREAEDEHYSEQKLFHTPW